MLAMPSVLLYRLSLGNHQHGKPPARAATALLQSKAHLSRPTGLGAPQHMHSMNGIQWAHQRYSPSGTPSFFLYSTFSFAFLKSVCVTRMRLSRSASRPASVHIALMSAPDSSSCSHAKESCNHAEAQPLTTSGTSPPSRMRKSKDNSLNASQP